MGLIPGEVDEHLLSRLMGEPHHGVCLFGPFMVEVVELGPLISMGIISLILFVEDLEGYSLFLQLPIEIVKIGPAPLLPSPLWGRGGPERTSSSMVHIASYAAPSRLSLST